MDEFTVLVRRTVRITLYLTVLWCVLWAVAPAWKSIFSGLAIGTAVSTYFALSVARQTEMAAAVALQGKKKKPAIPLFSRIAMILLAVLIALKLSYPNVLVMIFSFFTYQGVILAGMLANRGNR